MRQGLQPLPEVQLSIRNIGGITEASEKIRPGVTVLVGKNATNRTSFLQGIAAALGTDRFSVKRDADVAEVTLRTGQDDFNQRFERKGGQIVTEGEAYVDKPDVAELFAVLFESNPIRAAIRNDGDIRDLIVRPLDISEINNRISEIVSERRRVDERLDESEQIADRISDCQSKRAECQNRLEELDEEIRETEEALKRAQTEAESDIGQSEFKTELEEKLDKLHEKQSELEDIKESLGIERKSLESLRADRGAVSSNLEDVEPPESERVTTLEERMEHLRERKRSLDSTISELQQVIRFNQERLSEDGSGVFRSVGDRDDIIDQLNPGEQKTVCWTCGNEVSRDSIEITIERLQNLREERSSERSTVSNEIQSVRSTLSDLKSKRSEHERLSAKAEEIERKLSRRENTVERLEEKKTTVESRVRTLESEIEELKRKRQTEVLELQEEVSELRFQRRSVREKLSDIEAEIDSLQKKSADREQLESRRKELSEELRDLRTRVERLETEAIEAFNSHMEAILEALDYENIERIWLEATGEPIADGKDVTERVFELHVVRESSGGTLYEDSLEHLSESERELVGLVVALSGYLAHEVHEEVPFMLLDSLEMIDGERLADLACYLEEYVPYLVLVLLPDHAAAFDKRDSIPDHQITDI
jgi:DNA repair exonuclease SbcCD ATPase subunit